MQEDCFYVASGQQITTFNLVLVDIDFDCSLNSMIGMKKARRLCYVASEQRIYLNLI